MGAKLAAWALLLALLASPYSVAYVVEAHPEAARAEFTGGQTIVVAQDGSGDYSSIQEAVDAASSGDTILVMPGVYRESIRIETPGITIRGADRDAVVVDGGFQEGFADGFHIHRAAGVTISNLTVQRFLSNGIYFVEADYFRADNITALDNRLYGLYATHSRHGVFADSEAAGSGDSGFYFGEVFNCECVLERVVAHDNVIGYSGTRSTHIIIRDSWFYNNSVGILPNTLVPDIAHMLGEHMSLEAFWPSNYLIEGNIIENNNNRDVRAFGWTAQYGLPIGTGIALAGAMYNTIRDNLIRGHERWGIAEFFFLVPPLGNVFISNTFLDNARDFWRDGYGWGSCQEANTYSHEASATVFASCDLPGALRLSLPDPSKHIELMVVSERPRGSFPGERVSVLASPVGPEAGWIASLAVFVSAPVLMAAAGQRQESALTSERPRTQRRAAPARVGSEREAFRRRVLAALVDAGVVFGLYVLLISGLVLSFLPVASVAGLLEAVLTITLVFSPLAFIIYMAIWLLYGGFLEGIYGRTLGKGLLGLVVARVDGSPVGMARSFARNVLRYIDGALFYLVGLSSALLTRRRQRIGDLAAGTVVLLRQA